MQGTTKASDRKSTGTLDMRLPACKFFVFQLEALLRSQSETPFRFGKKQFQRVWIQGVIDIDGKGSSWVDDGTGRANLNMKKVQTVNPTQIVSGMYAVFVGNIRRNTDNSVILAVHQWVDLSADPDREALWMLDVIETQQKFYS
mmetsp:Transcript_20038/g.32878  ORF Transcript_20038/g.32878 Transcript_20038/m.32878 type:complete len:144 (+) Transcript_20038:66-497(+)|eukprot:CAMPEP_0184654122 /NCGR_PEP_ID=MMETSP0308-20130426/11836_1 /TAXON_ID=38269 /ORGANISM="Gloeochaete witrockiana, Strain SAG 46.84" /LENGTH=143 /DNA_ID=CAMNT_0027089965 /DNA_START=40 /DNA_END=471 /DNA_ORIENTATION=+